MSKRFRWACPHEWLRDKVAEKVEAEDLSWLMSLINLIAGELDHDQLQDLFSSAMDADGYFEPLGPNPHCLDCGGTGQVYRGFGYYGPCLCNPEHGAHH